MEGGLPMLNCVLQQTLRSLCSCSDSSNSSKWVYAVFWKILPRNYPPPKWDYGGSFLDRSKGNKRNWILVWEDGFCDFYECERAGSGYIKGRFGADVFFKMSHEVYNYGEGLVGKVAAENTHKWVFKDIPPEKDPNLLSSWNASMDPQPKAWEFQFNSGIQTIAIISVKEGLIQLGSLEKIVEDLNLVISIQRKFSYLQSIPGVFTMQRPYLPFPNISSNLQTQITDTKNGFFLEENCNVTSGKRCYGERFEEFPSKSINFGWNSPQINRGEGEEGGEGLPFCSIPPLLPTMSCSFEALLSKLPSVIPSLDTIGATDKALSNNKKCNYDGQRINDNGGMELTQISQIKTESCNLDTSDEEKHQTSKGNPSLEDYNEHQTSKGNPSLEDYNEGLEVGERGRKRSN